MYYHIRKGHVMSNDFSNDNQQLNILPDGRMTVEDAANYLGLSISTLARYRRVGGGPPYIYRGRVFYYKADLDQWLQDGYQQGGLPA